jgi:hypothetical protein
MIPRWVPWFLHPWIIIGSIFIGLALLASTVIVLVLTRPSPAAANLPPTAIITLIAMPTDTLPPPTPTPPDPETPVPTEGPLPEPGDVALGSLVQISGTGGDGLRLRVEPGLDGEVRLLGLEAEVFQVSDGPREVDGFTWWFLVAPFDETRSGWAVSNYLAPTTQNP